MKSGHGRATLKIKLGKKTNWNCMFHNTSYWYVWGPSQQRTGQVSGMKMNQETGKWKEKKSRGGKEEEESERGRKWRSSLRSGGRLGHYITAAAAGIDNALSVFSHNNCLWTTHGYECLTFFFFFYCIVMTTEETYAIFKNSNVTFKLHWKWKPYRVKTKQDFYKYYKILFQSFK